VARIERGIVFCSGGLMGAPRFFGSVMLHPS
jgi:hypothetical protein